MSKLSKRTFLTIAATLTLSGALAGALSGQALAEDDQAASRPRGLHRLRERIARTVSKMAQERRDRFTDLLSSLAFTDEQRRAFLDKARAAVPLAESARAEARRVVAEARAEVGKAASIDRKALRETIRGKLKALREKAWS